ncbi:N6-adenosine-methyltransferase subunit METTL3 [Trichogramma pretiosum]|uniref:N6-adenosine-methyltransferase subunit METTL3 n=1 Tax=Trichogramma pretiosum TaxID=7493 RepID=UPI0006C96B7C|nr:N6-adenosine-methyltransferase subunit METTL3 [Trichogramma pretiosum]
MSDAFEEIQAIKIKRNCMREKLQKRKRERHELFTLTSGVSLSSSPNNEPLRSPGLNSSRPTSHTDYERDLIGLLHEAHTNFPITSAELMDQLRKTFNADITHSDVNKLLEKLAAQNVVKIKEVTENGVFGYTVLSLTDVQLHNIEGLPDIVENAESTESATSETSDQGLCEKKTKLDEKGAEDIMSLISMPTIREKENKKYGEQILNLLSKQTSKEKSLAERFRSQGGAQVMEFCPHGTKVECVKLNQGFASKCKKLHFKKIIQAHTDESLGDCSFLNTCFHMDTCKYVHYEVDYSSLQQQQSNVSVDENTTNGTSDPKHSSTTCLSVDSPTSLNKSSTGNSAELTLYPPQWIQCDLRYLDMTVLGKFAVIMADPPWDIHMELPYGTMSDDEMRQLGIPALQDEGLLFLWVTGRAMELGRECLQLWGYERVDEIIWVKTNQLQRIIRTGRTGHWLNHGKEHCLVGMKGNPRINRGLDSDVIVAEVRATSHKPDEIYGIIERMSPGTRKIELFGRPHNVQPNWITLGNQVDGVHLIDPQLIKAFKKRYPDGNSMKPAKA